MLYTTDGSDPDTKAGGSTKELAAGSNTISVEPKSNADDKVTVKAIAVKDGKASSVAKKTVEFVKIPDADQGTKGYTADISRSGVMGGPYQIKVRVTTVNGKIAKVEDNGTIDGMDLNDDGASTDYSFWYGFNVMGDDSDYNYENSMPAKLYGKTLADVLNMKTVPDDMDYNVDATSGATVWSDSIRHAVIAALRSEPVSESETTVPTLTLSSDDEIVANKEDESIGVTMTADEGLTIHYTLDGTDPTEESPVAEKYSWNDDLGVELTADPTTYPDGRVIEVRAKAFDASDVVRGFYTFANPRSDVSYVASYSGTSGTAEGVTATVTTESPDYSGNYYITKIKIADLTNLDPNGDYVPELLSRIYLAQKTEGVEAVKGYETESQKVLAAVKAALDQLVSAKAPTITLSPDNNVSYNNDQEVTVTLETATPGADIYYTVDNSNTTTGGTLSDPTESGTKYTGPFTVNIDNAAGGNLYIRAAAKVGEDGKWSSIVREDLTFVKAVAENAFVVDGKNYTTWNDAVDALATAQDKTLTINDDVELTENDKLPSVACTIVGGTVTGGDADKTHYTLTGPVMDANADLTFDNLEYGISRIYANGHNITVNDTVTTTWGWSGKGIYAGGNGQDVTISGGASTITVNGGEFEILASGTANTTLTGNVTVNVGGAAEVELSGAGLDATTNGNVTFNVDGTAGLSFGEFYGEQNGGVISGDMLLKIVGTPKISSWATYMASVQKEQLGDVYGQCSERTIWYARPQ